MTPPINPLQQANDPNVLRPFMDFLTALVGELWWVVALFIVFITIRAYVDHTTPQQGDISEQGFRGILLFFISSGYGLVLAVGGVFLFVLTKIGNLLQISPFVAWGIGAGDPITLGSIAASIVAGFAAFDLEWATLSNTVLVFVAVAGGLVVLDSLQSASEAVDDDDDEDDD